MEECGWINFDSAGYVSDDADIGKRVVSRDIIYSHSDFTHQTSHTRLHTPIVEGSRKCILGIQTPCHSMLIIYLYTVINISENRLHARKLLKRG